MAITRTTLATPVVRRQLHNALIDTTHDPRHPHHPPSPRVRYLKNRRGRRWLAVWYLPDPVNRRCQPFLFLDRDGRDVSQTVYSVLRTPQVGATAPVRPLAT